MRERAKDGSLFITCSQRMRVCSIFGQSTWHPIITCHPVIPIMTWHPIMALPPVMACHPIMTRHLIGHWIAYNHIGAVFEIELGSIWAPLGLHLSSIWAPFEFHLLSRSEQISHTIPGTWWNTGSSELVKNPQWASPNPYISRTRMFYRVPLSPHGAF